MQAHLADGPTRLVKLEQALVTGALGPIAANEPVDPLAKDLIMLEDGLGRLPDEGVPLPSPSRPTSNLPAPSSPKKSSSGPPGLSSAPKGWGMLP